ncbi:hypothetical protein [Streptomyces erythrochromogenes]|uniref:hypothetical protein n=1 Tax=Streptomyces erythrochromogenes TaxID=285574 RepID=UPI00343CB445
MSNAPVDAANVPVFTGQLSVLDEKVKALSADGGALANAGSSVHTTFGGMSAYYQAPEAEQLFAVTKPVVDITLSFSSDMCTIAGALGTYAQEIRPLVKKLEELKAEAASFQSKVSRDEDWIEDEDLIDENLARRNEIAEVWAQFQTAERHAHDKIVALVCGAPLKVNDGSNGEGMYGYDAEALKQSKSLPWGDAVEESVPAWQVWEHLYDFGKGVFVDGVWGTIKGLGTLVGFDGWDAAGQAWTGLGKLATGVIITATPAAAVFWLADDKDLPPWIRDSRTAMKETGKALLAWDQWGSNPSRAAGAVTFNVVTTVFTGGTGGAAAGAGKAGLAAKTLSLAGKAGRAIDPMTYVFKGAGAGVSKIGDVMAGLKNMGKVEVPKIDEGAFSLPDGAVELPDGTIRLPKGTPTPEGALKVSDDTIKLPEGTASLPPGTVKWPFDGPAKYADPAGNLYKEDGSLYQKAGEARPEPSPKIDTGANTPRTEVPVRRETPVLAGVGGRVDDVVRVGSDISDPVRAMDNGAHGLDNTPTGRAGDHAPGGRAPDGMPRNSTDSHSPGTGGHQEPPSTAGHTDGPGGGGHGHGDGPGGGHESPSTGGGSHEPPPAAGSHSDTLPGDGRGSGGLTGADGPNGPAAWERSADGTGPLQRGSELEQQVRDQIRAVKVKHPDIEPVLKTLSESPFGKEMADTIASGRFTDADGFKTVVSNLVRPSEIPGSLEAMRLGNRLHDSGVTDVSFEVKQGGNEIRPGVFTGEKTDLDVMARDADGRVHGWQFKDMTGPDSSPIAAKSVQRIFKSIHQLLDSNADVQTFVIDSKIPRAEMETQLARLQEKYDTKGVQFVIRTPDGVIFVPVDGKFMPEVAP